MCKHASVDEKCLECLFYDLPAFHSPSLTLISPLFGCHITVNGVTIVATLIPGVSCVIFFFFVGRALPNRKNNGKIPKKIHKAEREKLKRDHLNELFLELGHVLGNLLKFLNPFLFRFPLIL